MAVATEQVSQDAYDIAADVPISVTFPLYNETEVVVYYGIDANEAVLNADYVVSLIAPDYAAFDIVPTQSLIDKIDALIAANPTVEVNRIFILRDTAFTTSSTPALVASPAYQSRENDRSTAREQELKDGLRRTLKVSPTVASDLNFKVVELSPGRALVFDVDDPANVVAGPTIGDMEDAEAARVAAEAAAAEADSDRIAAQAAADAALLDAADAAAAASAASASASAAAASEANAAQSAEDAADVLAGAELSANKGQPNGYAGLDAFGKVPLEQLPEDGSFQGNWDASTNTPTLTAGVGIPGQEYYVAVSGTQSITGSPVAFAQGDTITFSAGNVWTHQPNPDGPAIALKADKSLVLTGGAGMAAIGDLSTNRTVALSAASQASLAKADTSVQPGDFGIGDADTPTTLTDCDDNTIPAGNYRVNSSTTGTKPWGATTATFDVVVRYSAAGWQTQEWTGRHDAGIRAGRTWKRVFNGTLDTWTDFTTRVDAETLRVTSGYTGLATPMHFERSIPLNSWEQGVRGHDTSPTDETAAIQALIDKAVAERRDIAWQATKYKCNNIALSGVYELRMFGVGGKPFFLPGDTLLASGGDLFEFRRPNGAGYVYLGTGAEPASDIIVNEDGIIFAANANPGVGNYIGWTSNREWYYDARDQWWKGEFHEVGRASGNTIWLKDATHDAYDVSAEVLTVSSWVASRLELHNLGFGDPELTTPPAQATTALSFNRCKRAILDDIETYNFSGPHISQRQNDATQVNNVQCWGGGTADEIGYGLSNLAVINSRYTDIKGGGMRRLIDFSGTGTEGCGPSRNNIVDGFHCYGGGRDAANVSYEPHGAKPSFAVGTHGPAENITFKNGKICNVGSGVTVRGRNTKIHNVEFYGWILRECVYATYGEGLEVKGCSYTSNDYGQKDQQGVAISAGRRCPTFVRFGLDSEVTTDAEYAFLMGNLPVVITNNNYDGLTDDFVEFMPSQATQAPKYFTMVNNKGMCSDSSGDFYTIRNLTGANLVFSASEMWGNDVLPRGDSDIGASHDDGTVIVGGRLSGSLSQDRVSKVGPRTWRIYMGGNDNSDNYVRIKDFAPYGASDASVRISVTGHNGNDTINFDGWIKENNASPIVIYQGANIAFSATPTQLDGDGGTSGKVTMGLSPGGTLHVENRMGATRVFDVTVH